MRYIKLTPKDEELINVVHMLLKESGRYMVEEFDLHHWEFPYSVDNIKNDTELKNVYLVEENGKYIATFMYTSKASSFFVEIEDGKSVYISKFAVNPLLTRSGTGTKCLKFIEETIVKDGFNKIRLDVYDKSEQAINFYHKNGFVDLYKKPTRRFEVICMEKEIL